MPTSHPRGHRSAESSSSHTRPARATADPATPSPSPQRLLGGSETSGAVTSSGGDSLSISRRRTMEELRPKQSESSKLKPRALAEGLKEGEVHQLTPLAQYVERDVQPTPVQEVPVMHVGRGPAAAGHAGGGGSVGGTTMASAPPPPPVTASKRAINPRFKQQQARKRPSSGSNGGVSWLTGLRRMIFSREEFRVEEAASPLAPTPSQQRLIDALSRVPLPQWTRETLFDISEFFSLRRVQIVMFAIIIAMIFSVRSEILELFGNAASTFIVAESDRPGLTFFERFNNGSRELPHRHPVIIIPGFITSALELWESNVSCVKSLPFASSMFRIRMFGPEMIYLILRDPYCWLELFSMAKTGFDKPNIKVRADSGFASVDYFVPGYWVWAKVLVNLADIGYDPQSLAVMTYDWRLSPESVHTRDGFFYAVRNNIKFLCQKNRERAVVISHSYGTTVALAFFKWTEEREPGFMDRYVAYYINVGGTAMGAPKALSAILMGDVKDTISIPRPARRMLDTFVSQSARYNFTRSFSCLAAMLPHSCDDMHPNVLAFPNGTVLTMHGAADLVIQECERTGHKDCVRHVKKYRQRIDELPVLPQAPHTTAVCLYGVNKLAEVGYRLEAEGGGERAFVTNGSYYDKTTNQGVVLGDGDGTVPLMSLAYMCRAPNGWRQNVKRVVTMEHLHDPEKVPMLNLRGGGVSGDHVDILGNYQLLETLLKIASGLLDDNDSNAGKHFVYVDPETNETVVEPRTLNDRIYSDVDERIRTKMRTCLAKVNTPIQPVPIGDDAERKYL